MKKYTNLNIITQEKYNISKNYSEKYNDNKSSRNIT